MRYGCYLMQHSTFMPILYQLMTLRTSRLPFARPRGYAERRGLYPPSLPPASLLSPPKVCFLPCGLVEPLAHFHNFLAPRPEARDRAQCLPESPRPGLSPRFAARRHYGLFSDADISISHHAISLAALHVSARRERIFERRELWRVGVDRNNSDAESIYCGSFRRADSHSAMLSRLERLPYLMLNGAHCFPVIYGA